jgi:hypothetical protein
MLKSHFPNEKIQKIQKKKTLTMMDRLSIRESPKGQGTPKLKGL